MKENIVFGKDAKSYKRIKRSFRSLKIRNDVKVKYVVYEINDQKLKIQQLKDNQS